MAEQTDVADQRPVRFANSVSARGFTIIPNVVLNDSTLSVGARMLYAMLRSYAWQEASCWPGQERLCETLGVTDKTLRRYVAELVAVQLVKVERRGRGMTNAYVLFEPRSYEGGGKSPVAEHGKSPGEEDAVEEHSGSALATARADGGPPQQSVARRRNLPFDALVESCPGTDPSVDAGMVAKALKEIRSRLESEARATADPRGEHALAVLNGDVTNGATGNARLADEIRRRAVLYRERWPDVELTPTALAKHFTRLVADRPKGAAASASEIATMFDE